MVGAALNVGGKGGPGGFPGGAGTLAGSPDPAGGGQGPGGGGVARTAGIYGAPSGFGLLLPLFGGSGGGGGNIGSSGGASGGGGGGAIVIASSTQITVNGSISARGGQGLRPGGPFSCGSISGPGSGGAIRLVAPTVNGSGSLVANGGTTPGCQDIGGSGIVRLEAFTLDFNGPVTNISMSVAPGPVTSASTPPLITFPTLAISSVGEVSSPSSPIGSYSTADVSLPAGTVNPVLVTLAMTNTPVGTVFSVRLIPQVAAVPTTVSSTPSSGAFSSSTANASVTFPFGQISVLNVFASFTLPTQLASLAPLIDGEPVERVMLAANMDQPSTLTLVTKSGKEVPAKEVMDEKQLALLLKGVMLQK